MKSTLAAAGVKQFVITPDGSVLFVLRNNTIERYQISDTQVKRTDSVPVDGFTGSEPVSIALLPGASSVIVTSKDGQVSQWFQVLKEGTRDLALIRTFNADGSIAALQSEVHRKSLVVLNDKGTLTLWNATSEKTDHFALPSLAGVTHIGLSASSKTLVSEKNGQWELFAVNNPHPEVSMRSLWQKVWYENYPEPAFVWQSTTADDDVEVKLSVIPMFFGTIKVVLFSMFIAIPLAIGGAIYTAYLMPRGYERPSSQLLS
ncbi:hypothetical protein [Veronia nyctiphanis]|uniref:hypothetical protein n=1 Tax=Veronia nyctiphanis TaxID=1278244 RepID=UPI001F369D8D|nr:hypothetical protein [Veronia nyctiphanis]